MLFDYEHRPDSESFYPFGLSTNTNKWLTIYSAPVVDKLRYTPNPDRVTIRFVSFCILGYTVRLCRPSRSTDTEIKA
jgi:hypothetical protein